MQYPAGLKESLRAENPLVFLFRLCKSGGILCACKAVQAPFSP